MQIFLIDTGVVHRDIADMIHRLLGNLDAVVDNSLETVENAGEFLRQRSIAFLIADASEMRLIELLLCLAHLLSALRDKRSLRLITSLDRIHRL